MKDSNLRTLVIFERSSTSLYLYLSSIRSIISSYNMIASTVTISYKLSKAWSWWRWLLVVAKALDDGVTFNNDPRFFIIDKASDNKTVKQKGGEWWWSHNLGEKGNKEKIRDYLMLPFNLAIKSINKPLFDLLFFLKQTSLLLIGQKWYLNLFLTRRLKF